MAEPYEEPQRSEFVAGDPWRMAEEFTMKCGCIVTILLEDYGDYGEEGWHDIGQRVQASKMHTPCSEHTKEETCPASTPSQ